MVVRLLFDSLDLEDLNDEKKNKDLSVIAEKLDHLNQIAGRILDFGKSRESFRRILLSARYWTISLFCSG